MSLQKKYRILKEHKDFNDEGMGYIVLIRWEAIQSGFNNEKEAEEALVEEASSGDTYKIESYYEKIH